MKKKLLTAMITAGLVFSMSVPAFATTQIKATVGFESSFIQESESTTKNTMKDIQGTILSNPTIPKLKVTLKEALSTYTELIENYNTAKTEVDRKAILDELENLINAIREVIPDLNFIEYDNIISGGTTNKENTSVSEPKDIRDPLFKNWLETLPVATSSWSDSTNYTVNGKSYFFNSLCVEERQGGFVRIATYSTRIADFANALRNTEKKFSFVVDKANKAVYITRGGSYTPVGNENKKIDLKDTTVEYYTLYVDNRPTNIEVAYNPDMGAFSRSEALCSAVNAAYVYDKVEWILHDTPENVVTSKDYEGESPFIDGEAPPVVTNTVSKSTANPTSSKVLVNGKAVGFDAYNINNNNYFKLRDVAQIIRGTDKQFNVTWDGSKNAINLISNTAYESTGGELTSGDGVSKQSTLSTSTIYKDGIVVKLTAYTINGNNYFKLRDLGKVFDFSVTWDSTNNAIVIDTTQGYTE